MPSIDTLVKDIYKLFDPKETHVPNEENLEEFADSIKNLFRERLSKRDDHSDVLRFSSLGKRDRQLWYAAQKDVKREEMTAKNYVKFAYGDLIEHMFLFLAKEAGHDVTRTQEEIEVLGVKGHIDAVIDGVLVDVKSASPFSYKKFENGSIVENDPFGYIQQVSGYANVITPGVPGAFLAINKVDGEFCVAKVPDSIAETINTEERITHLKEVIKSPTPPERCYEDELDGKSGNRKLGTNCSYCGYKDECWPGLRTFLYSNGPRYLTQVSRLPDVYEVQK